MKNFLLTILMIVISVPAMLAQPHGAMKFVGPSTFGVAAMDAWQDNENDTILFLMNSGSDADITIPAMFYKAMNLTIPSFTIHGAQFSMDFTTRNAIFAEQTFEETITVEGEEKQIKGTSFSAFYNHAEKVFELQLVVSYGKMPFPVTYSVKATYVSPETGIASLTSPLNGGSQGYNLSGMHMNTNTLPLREGQGVGLRGIYIINGKKMLMR
ncbi:MAG: hypothetical protein IKH43_03600 [Bacteroidaceae bacterium]|nr:hypothetical protein [Bacteroidaceae bacterium]